MFKLPELNYEYDALEPHFDVQTMEIHHAKHHQTYVDNLNNALESLKSENVDRYDTIREKAIESETAALEFILQNLDMLPSSVQTAVRNNGGGHLNHSFFWQTLASETSAQKQPTGKLLEAVENKFGDFDNFKDEFKKAALGRFGSGWAWLVKNSAGEVEIISTPNQDSPISDGLIPIIGVDVWEHAYYLKYQNRRADFIDAYWNVLD
ncbi:MAG: superoxide dismutase, partial [Candidatus Sacchiramonaceae bacterium]|nr:superoxide dismutase [Candidatus Saccharimonadaceae bacterium]